MLVFGSGEAAPRAQDLTGSERLLADLLRKMDRPNGLAIYSTSLRKARGKREAEADFIVLWDGAVLVLEVKGGTVGRDASGDWWLDSPPRPRRAIQPPMDQARVEMYALRDLIRDLDGIDLRDAMTYAVVTPYTQAPPEDVGWHPVQWIGSDTLRSTSLAEALDALAGSVRQRYPTDAPELQWLRERLTREFIGVANHRVAYDAVRDEQDRMTGDQARFFLAMRGVRRSMLLGGAGTGKSLMLVMAARQHSLAGRNVLVTCKSRSLLPMFESQLAGTPVVVAATGDLASLDAEFDVVLVDEAQDLMNEIDIGLIFSKVRGGYEDGEWTLALDPNNQAHVQGAFSGETYEQIADGHPSFPLTLNVRNTSEMVVAVQANLHADIGAPTIAHGRAIRWEDIDEHDDLEVRVQRIVASIATAVDVDSADEVVVISAAGPSESEPADTGRRQIAGVPYLAAHEAKGLEFDHVVVVDVPRRPTTADLAATYVAMTRARISLTVVLSAASRAWMRENAMEMLTKDRMEQAR
ncbi:nuclease-related domain-containing DEAD/DEAH box helicase [Agrococcus jejuensis]|uniref:Nuclease-related domain-containing protein n=1 Tax=Agrococcus jejuensis TaxID=399736 RepID=A0A1G8CH81_9MICO|nr:nuclease-related domain-containing protein [Agrococcus jejuensis]SDH44280.1 Nuclease-related domain-containing protein [Agrococcus jejuensis]